MIRTEPEVWVKPNFAKAYSRANEILASSKEISTFPFSPIAVIAEQTGFVCRSYAKALQYGVDMRAFGSESAVIMTFSGRTIIFYDDSKPMSHVSFSILHELGHAANEHDFRTREPETYNRYEVEANYFAAQMLIPEQLLREMQKRGMRITSSFLQSAFGVSKAAADKRIITLSKTNVAWRTEQEQEYDDIILVKYEGFLNSVCPRREIYDLEQEYERQSMRDRWY